ncbi:CGNR zinc finger domain-containing protein [Demequina lutea]|uniref:Putative RNA-binding Zn ribbon-like protein n=1 Tax=Demequina lutea TaxID=431489 RepID=A0A7Z0CJZ2_9MICO|nr:CGNR zinc finger domain-containing protein [Demequina lutea]NYI41297.1 putative RNA-binding Zn ribbon-like protein [Demequina lutea]
MATALKGMMTRPSGSHRDQLVFAAIALTNRLADGWSFGARYTAPEDPAECASIANETCERFYRKQTAFLPEQADELKVMANRLHDVLLDLALDDIPTAIPKVNTMLAEHPSALHLSEKPPYSLHYQDHSVPAVQGWQVACCAALASWVSSNSTQYIRCCAALRCDRLFVDDTRSGTKRFCSIQCHGRENVRAYRLRQAVAAAEKAHRMPRL